MYIRNLINQLQVHTSLLTVFLYNLLSPINFDWLIKSFQKYAYIGEWFSSF